MGRLFVTSCVAAAALLLPDTALAHVGSNAPVATNFEARISGVKPATDAVRAKVVDGDRQLWLRVNAHTTVLIPGAVGEPLLRFDHGGVYVNRHSLTAQSDRIDRFDLRPGPNPRMRPLWHRLTTGHSYRWHEHRLHAFEPLARGHQATTVIGHWSVPLLIDGRRHALEGVLVYRPPGSAWPWIVLTCALAAVTSAALLLPSPAAQGVAVLVALVVTLLVWAVRIGRELYGRPGVGVTGYVEIALTSLVGIALLCGLLNRDQPVRLFTAWLASFGCLYQGLTMLPLLTHAVALTVLPSFGTRITVAVILGLGGGLLAITMREQFADDVDERTTDAKAETKHTPRPIRRPGPT